MLKQHIKHNIKQHSIKKTLTHMLKRHKEHIKHY